MWVRFHIAKPIGLIVARRRKYNLRYTGEENAPYRGPFIIVANHQTIVDVFAVGLAIRRVLNRCPLKPWAKLEVKKGREGFFGWFLWHYLRTIPIDRGAVNEAPKAIKASIHYLRKGQLVFIHPEGTRFPPGTLGPFKFGVANLARAVPCPILPVGIWRRPEDNGIQVRIGLPFYMPDLREHEPPEESVHLPEGIFFKHVDTLKKRSRQLAVDKRGMQLVTRMLEVVEHMFLSLGESSYQKVCRLASPADNEFLRDKVMELLPEGWTMVDSKEEAMEVSKVFPADGRSKSTAQEGLSGPSRPAGSSHVESH